jgi:hypothetical protein
MILIGLDGHVCVQPLSGYEKAIVAAPVAMKPRRVIFNAMMTSHRVSVPRTRVVGAVLPVLQRPALQSRAAHGTAAR